MAAETATPEASATDAESPLVAVAGALRLSGIVAIAWVVAAIPAQTMGGRDGLVGSLVAAGLCIAPCWVVPIATGLYGLRANSLAAIGVATCSRLFVVMGGFLSVQSISPEWGLWEFTAWLLAFYLVALAAETLTLVGKLTDESPADAPDPSSNT